MENARPKLETEIEFSLNALESTLVRKAYGRIRRTRLGITAIVTTLFGLVIMIIVVQGLANARLERSRRKLDSTNRNLDSLNKELDTTVKQLRASEDSLKAQKDNLQVSLDTNTAITKRLFATNILKDTAVKIANRNLQLALLRADSIRKEKRKSDSLSDEAVGYALAIKAGIELKTNPTRAFRIAQKSLERKPNDNPEAERIIRRAFYSGELYEELYDAGAKILSADFDPASKRVAVMTEEPNEIIVWQFGEEHPIWRFQVSDGSDIFLLDYGNAALIRHKSNVVSIYEIGKQPPFFTTQKYVAHRNHRDFTCWNYPHEFVINCSGVTDVYRIPSGKLDILSLSQQGLFCDKNEHYRVFYDEGLGTIRVYDTDNRLVDTLGGLKNVTNIVLSKNSEIYYTISPTSNSSDGGMWVFKIGQGKSSFVYGKEIAGQVDPNPFFSAGSYEPLPTQSLNSAINCKLSSRRSLTPDSVGLLCLTKSAAMEGRLIADKIPNAGAAVFDDQSRQLLELSPHANDLLLAERHDSTLVTISEQGKVRTYRLGMPKQYQFPSRNSLAPLGFVDHTHLSLSNALGSFVKLINLRNPLDSLTINAYPSMSSISSRVTIHDSIIFCSLSLMCDTASLKDQNLSVEHVSTPDTEGLYSLKVNDKPVYFTSNRKLVSIPEWLEEKINTDVQLLGFLWDLRTDSYRFVCPSIQSFENFYQDCRSGYIFCIGENGHFEVWDPEGAPLMPTPRIEGLKYLTRTSNGFSGLICDKLAQAHRIGYPTAIQLNDDFSTQTRQVIGVLNSGIFLNLATGNPYLFDEKGQISFYDFESCILQVLDANPHSFIAWSGRFNSVQIFPHRYYAPMAVGFLSNSAPFSKYNHYPSLGSLFHVGFYSIMFTAMFDRREPTPFEIEDAMALQFSLGLIGPSTSPDGKWIVFHNVEEIFSLPFAAQTINDQTDLVKVLGNIWRPRSPKEEDELYEFRNTKPAF